MKGLFLTLLGIFSISLQSQAQLHPDTRALLLEAIDQRIASSKKIVCKAPYNTSNSYGLAETYVGAAEYITRGAVNEFGHFISKSSESNIIPEDIYGVITIPVPSGQRLFAWSKMKVYIKRKLYPPKRNPSVIVYLPGVFTDPTSGGQKFMLQRTIRMLGQVADYVISFPNSWSAQWISNIKPFPGRLDTDSRVYANLFEAVLKRLRIGQPKNIRLAVYGESHGSMLAGAFSERMAKRKNTSLRLVQLISPPKDLITSSNKIDSMIRYRKDLERKCKRSGFTKSGSLFNIKLRTLGPDWMFRLRPKSHPDCLALEVLESVFGNGLKTAYKAIKKRETFDNHDKKRPKDKVHYTRPIFFGQYLFRSLRPFENANGAEYYKQGRGKLSYWWSKLNQLHVPRMLVSTDNDFINYRERYSGTLKQRRSAELSYWRSLKGGSKIIADHGGHLGELALANYSKRIQSALKAAFAAPSKAQAHNTIRPGVWSSESLSKRDLQQIRKNSPECNFPFNLSKRKKRRTRSG